ncbi:MAG: fimbria major subunit [Bacteroidales bacterium]|nr:fimbria major subunit [Bacteroidales bacterium]MBP5764200.1 fimbria major subunit [Bacteroidales bacterium]
MKLIRYSRHNLLLSFLLVMMGLVSCNDEDEGRDGFEATTIVGVGDAIPEFSVSGSDGQSVTSASLAGQSFVLNFFDTRCPDCWQELQELQSLHDRFDGRVSILNIPRSQTESEVQSYWDSEGLTMLYHIPADKDLYYKFAKSIVPRTYMVNGEGVVCAAFGDDPVATADTLSSLLKSWSANRSVRLSFNISVPSFSAADDYFQNEYSISRLEVYFFHADTKKFFTKLVADKSNLGVITQEPGYDITYLFKDLTLTADVYDVFLIANYDYAPAQIATEAEFLDLVDNLTYSEGVMANIPDNGPVMTSSPTAFLGVDFVPWMGEDYALWVEMERVMAKLRLGVSKNTFPLYHLSEKYADINITNYKLVNLSTDYYLFQHRDNLNSFIARSGFIFPDNYLPYTDAGDVYVVDPHFYQKTLNQADAKSFSNCYQSWYGDFNTTNFASMPSADNYGYAYVLENTAFRTSQKNGYSPGIVYKAAVSPVCVWLYDNVQRVLKKETRPEYWPKTLYLFNFNFYGSIQAVNKASGFTLDELATYTDAQLLNYGIKQCKFNMGVYETYYTYWIEHRTGSVTHMGPMEYGIIRNNFYRITIKDVTGLGNSVITPDIMRDNYPNSFADIEVSLP